MDQKPFPEQEILYFSQRKLCQTSGPALSVVPQEDEEGAACRLPAPAATGHREKWLPSPTECFPTGFTNKSTNKVVFFWLLIGDQDLQRKLHTQAFQHGSARITSTQF